MCTTDCAEKAVKAYREHVIALRLTRKEITEVAEAAARMGLPAAVFVRTIVLSNVRQPAGR